MRSFRCLTPIRPLLVATLATLAACGDSPQGPESGDTPGGSTVYRVTIDPEEWVLLAGASQRFSAYIEERTDCDIDYCRWKRYSGSVSWSSSDSSVATVAGGLVTGVGAGTATIRAFPNSRSSGAVTLSGDSGLQGSSAASATVHVIESYAPVATVSAGMAHSCASGPGGAVYCWGAISFKVSGTDLGVSGLPRQVSTGQRFATVTSGPTHACGITTAGDGMCWGEGAIGFAGRTYTDVPSPINGDHVYTSLSAGLGVDVTTSFTCGTADTGATYCWGTNEAGQLGTDSMPPTCIDPPTGPSPFCSNPLRVKTSVDFVSVSAGGRHACALTAPGEAYCWGSNEWGQLGDSTVAGSFQPIPVSGGLTFASLHAGLDYTCGVTGAGQTYCWGRNDRGQLGSGARDADLHSLPEPVSGGLSFAVLDAGGFACGLDANGALYCWGDAPDGYLSYGPGPTAVSPGFSFDDVKVGYGHACGVSQERGYCWGTNDFGRLGSLPPGNRAPTPHPISGPLP